MPGFQKRKLRVGRCWRLAQGHLEDSGGGAGRTPHFGFRAFYCLKGTALLYCFDVYSDSFFNFIF